MKINKIYNKTLCKKNDMMDGCLLLVVRHLATAVRYFIRRFKSVLVIPLVPSAWLIYEDDQAVHLGASWQWPYIP